MTGEALPAPLEGIRVLELAESDCGPFCGRLLADLGADVIKVEHPRRRHPGQPADSAGGDGEDGRDGGCALYVDWGKYSITLDPTAAAGGRLLRELVSASDALICDYERPRAAQLGLTCADFSALNPGLVWIDIAPFGSDGPWSDFAAAPLTTQAASGVCERVPNRGAGGHGRARGAARA
jgi:itaconate CoA-transferase